MSFKVGDFVECSHSGNNNRLIISLDGMYKRIGRDGDIWVLYLDTSVGYIVHGAKSMYKEIQPTKELLEHAKSNIQLVFDKKGIDNLTYVELYARMREYEQSF